MTSFSFFHPAYLWVLCLLVIPIIIHFLKQKRILKLNFSSTRFLKDIAVRATQINRLKNILLLIVRILMLILIVLIFAQPFNKKNPFQYIAGGNSALYCWIDPTMSMSYNYKDVTLRQHACNSISYLDSILPNTSEIYCYNGRINKFIGIRNTASSRGVSEVCTSLRHGQTDMNDMIYTFLQFRNNDSRSPFLILFSDFSSKDKSLFEDFLNSSNVSFPILCVSMGDEDPWNYSINNPYIVLENRPVLKCDIKSKGRSLPHGEVVVELGSMYAGNKTVTLQKNDSQNVSIDISQSSGTKRGTIKFAVKDPYSTDNISFFLQHRTKRKKILIISDSDASLPISAVFQSISSIKWFPPVIKKTIDVSYNDLDSSDIIVLSDIKESTEILSIVWGKTGVSEKLILFSPYIGDVSNSLNTVIFNYLKMPFKLMKITSIDPLFPLLPDTVSNLWQGFPRLVDRDVSIYKYYSQIPGTPLLLMNNGSPLVTHIKDANSNSWIVFASPINITDANNMCETGFYAPVIDRLIIYGMGSIHHFTKDWIAGIPRPNPFSGARSSAIIYDSDNKSIAFWDRQTQVAFEKPGLYKIQPNNKPAYWITVSVDPAESRMEYEIPEVKKPNINYVKFIRRESFNSFISQYNSYSYNLIWIILIFFMISEIFLWKRKQGII